MAIPCQSLTFTWGGVALQEVQELEISQAVETLANEGIGRNAAFGYLRLTGQMTLTGRSMYGLKPIDIGRAKRMVITVPAPGVVINLGPPTGTVPAKLVLWAGVAKYDGQVVGATANGAVQFAHRFTLLVVSPQAGTYIA